MVLDPEPDAVTREHRPDRGRVAQEAAADRSTCRAQARSRRCARPCPGSPTSRRSRPRRPWRASASRAASTCASVAHSGCRCAPQTSTVSKPSPRASASTRVEPLGEGLERRECRLRRAVAVGPVVDREAGLAGDEVRRHERDRVRHFGRRLRRRGVRLPAHASKWADALAPHRRRPRSFARRARAAARATTRPPRPTGSPRGCRP